MFDAAREGNTDLLLAAIDAEASLQNLTNPKGTFQFQLSHTLIPLAPHAIQTQTLSR